MIALKTILATTTSFVSTLGLRPIWSTKNTEGQPATLGKEAEEILNENFSVLESEVAKKADLSLPDGSEVLYLSKPYRDTEYSKAVIDSDNRILESITDNGTKEVHALNIADAVDLRKTYSDYQSVITDPNNSILESITYNGTKQFHALNISEAVEVKTANTEYLYAITDGRGKELLSITKSGKVFFNPSQELENLIFQMKPQQPLRILGIGNSFTQDGMEYLPDLCKSSGLDNVTLARIYYGGANLSQHWDFYKNNSAVYTYEKSTHNNWSILSYVKTLRSAIEDEPWDIIIIQQVSGLSGRYDTFQPYLNDLIDAMLTNCTNAAAKIGYQMAWAYGRDCDNPYFDYYNKDQTTMYNAIVSATQQMMSETSIGLIIPSGTAIQSLRGTSLNNPPLDLTRDDQHIDLGVGRYTTASTWFQKLIAPFYNITVVGNSFRTNLGLPVTDNNARLCQLAAAYAVSRPFEISNLETQPNII